MSEEKICCFCLKKKKLTCEVTNEKNEITGMTCKQCFDELGEVKNKK